MTDPAKPRSAKIMLLGDIGVGKTSLAKRLVFDKFDGAYKTTIGVDVLTCDLKLSGACDHAGMRLVLWDTDGDFGQSIFSTMYIVGASAAVIVADATRPASFARMEDLVKTFCERFPGRPVKAIVNKIDLVDSHLPVPALAGIAACDVHRTSALTGEGVASMFLSIAETIWRRSI